MTAVLPTGPEPLLGVLVGLFPSRVRLINLDNALQFRQFWPARFAQPVQQEPCRLLGDPDLLGQLQAGHALAGCHQQIHGIQPLVQLDVAALENGPGADDEVFLALVAAIEAGLADGDPLPQPADRAARAGWPEPALQVDPSGLLIREHLEKLVGGDRDLRHGRNPLASDVNLVRNR